MTDGAQGDGVLTARQVAEAMLARDACSSALGIELLDVGPGRAVMRMTVRADMLNGHDIAHGGLVFTLADTTFAVACNSWGVDSVAAGAVIDFVRPVPVGTVLVATAEPRHQGRQAGVYDVTVSDPDGRLVAVFRGRSHALGSPSGGR